MRKECAQAITMAAQQVGYALKASDLKGINDRITQHRVLLARKDQAGFAALPRDEQLKLAGESALKEVMGEAMKKRQVTELAVLATAKNDATVKALTSSGMDELSALKSMTLTTLDGNASFDSAMEIDDFHLKFTSVDSTATGCNVNTDLGTINGSPIWKSIHITANGVSGDIDQCQITEEERQRKVNIEDLILDK